MNLVGNEVQTRVVCRANGAAEVVNQHTQKKKLHKLLYRVRTLRGLEHTTKWKMSVYVLLRHTDPPTIATSLSFFHLV